MVTIQSQTRDAIDVARRMLNASLDVADVPDGHPLERRINAAFIDLEEAFADLPSAGRNASALDHPGPAVRVVANRDMRRWPTTSGYNANETILKPDHEASKLASTPRPLMTKRFAGRRMISAREFLEALEEAALVISPFSTSDSFSMVQLARA